MPYNHISFIGGISLKLYKILANYPIKYIKGNINIDIKGIEHDSRKTKEDYLFIAQDGFTVDGHDYIDEAIDNGAIAVVISKDVEVRKGITIIKVDDFTDALAYFSCKYYNEPWRRMKVIGVTGTNGKTSITYFIKSIFDLANEKSSLLGTNGAIINERHVDLINTTPDSLAIYKLMDQMVEEDSKYCIMEVSSHALELKRVEYIDFQLAIFTNLTKDHLDFHLTMENYFQSKLKLFLRSKEYNIINLDDPYGRRIIEETANKVPYITYAIEEKADIFATDIEYLNGKLKFVLNVYQESSEIVFNSPGRFNIYNIMAAVACATIYGIDLDLICEALGNLESVKGRFQKLSVDKDFNIIIDFAHTPDGLEKVIRAMVNFTQGRIIVVFGAGGDRDRSKRPEMGEVVGHYADIAIVTSDNPRKEDPEKIINDIIEGIKRTPIKYEKILDRKEAIEFALKIAKSGDTILIAGKGHEEYIIYGDKKYPFKEEEIIKDLLTKI